MAVSRKQARARGSFAIPAFGIVVLLLCYWVLAQWHDMPAIVSRTLGSLR